MRTTRTTTARPTRAVRSAAARVDTTVARVSGAAALAFTLALVACGPPPPAANGGEQVGGEAPASGPPRDVAAIHRARCGACHTRVEPGQRTRAQFEAALARHHRRVKMTDEEWRRMIDYLSADGKVTAGGATAPASSSSSTGAAPAPAPAAPSSSPVAPR